MTWRNQLLSASFRGVAFKYRDAESSGGRRLVVHEYPTRDEPDTEDLGRKAREFTIEAYVLGDDYIAHRDRLVSALEEAGPGSLVHPYRGQISVVVRDFRFTESTREGGLARFSISFVEAGKAFAPQILTDTSLRLKDSASGSRTAMLSEFGRLFNVNGTSFLRSSAVELLGGLVGIGGTFTGASDLVGEPQQLGELLLGAFGGVSRLEDVRPALSFGADARPVPLTTPSRRQQAANQAAVIRLIQLAGVARAAEISAETDYPSLDEALTVRDELVLKMDELAVGADDDTFRAIEDLRTALVQDIITRSADTRRIVSHTAPATTPALVLAYDLYESVAMADEIVSRNRIRHPGFVPGGTQLEVLSDAL